MPTCVFTLHRRDGMNAMGRVHVRTTVGARWPACFPLCCVRGCLPWEAGARRSRRQRQLSAARVGMLRCGGYAAARVPFDMGRIRRKHKRMGPNFICSYVWSTARVQQFRLICGMHWPLPCPASASSISSRFRKKTITLYQLKGIEKTYFQVTIAAADPLSLFPLPF